MEKVQREVEKKFKKQLDDLKSRMLDTPDNSIRGHQMNERL